MIKHDKTVSLDLGRMNSSIKLFDEVKHNYECKITIEQKLSMKTLSEITNSLKILLENGYVFKYLGDVYHYMNTVLSYSDDFTLILGRPDDVLLNSVHYKLGLLSSVDYNKIKMTTNEKDEYKVNIIVADDISIDETLLTNKQDALEHIHLVVSSMKNLAFNNLSTLYDYLTYVREYYPKTYSLDKLEVFTLIIELMIKYNQLH